MKGKLRSCLIRCAKREGKIESEKLADLYKADNGKGGRPYLRQVSLDSLASAVILILNTGRGLLKSADARFLMRGPILLNPRRCLKGSFGELLSQVVSLKFSMTD